MKQIIRNDKKTYPATGSWKSELPMISDKCIACNKCIEHCPEATMFMGEMKVLNKDTQEKEMKKRAAVMYEFCKGCGVCAEICPVKAIVMKKIK